LAVVRRCLSVLAFAVPLEPWVGGQTLRARDSDLEGRDTAIRVFFGDQKVDRERPETDGLFGRIDVEVDGLVWHVCLLYSNLMGRFAAGQKIYYSALKKSGVRLGRKCSFSRNVIYFHPSIS
jgi:hypothetical protein